MRKIDSKADKFSSYGHAEQRSEAEQNGRYSAVRHSACWPSVQLGPAGGLERR